jgi:hypothetical protein
MNKFRKLGFIKYNGDPECEQFAANRRAERLAASSLRTWPLTKSRPSLAF